MNENRVSIEVKVYPLNGARGSVLAQASATIGGCFAVRNIRVMDGKNGPFVSMPQAKNGKGEWRDICFPTNADMRVELNQKVLDAYQQEIQKTRGTAQQHPSASSPAQMPQRRFPSRENVR